MSNTAEQRAPEQPWLEWSEQRGQWMGELEDGPFRLVVVAQPQGGGSWRVLLRDCTGQAEMMRQTLEVEVPEANESVAILEKLRELGETWKQDPSLLFDGWGRP